MRKSMIGAALALGFLMGTRTASPDGEPVVMFDFDTAPTMVDFYGLPGLQWTDSVSGLTITVVRDGAPLTVVNLGMIAPTFGTGSLSPFQGPEDHQQVDVYFTNVPADMGVERLDWEMGDFVGADDDGWTVRTVDVSGDHAVGMEWQVISDADFLGQPFATTSGWTRRKYPIAVWSFVGGSDLFPMSLFLDNLKVTLGGSIGGQAAFVGGSDEPESVPGGDGDPVSVDGDADGGLGTVIELAYDGVNGAGLPDGTANSLLVKLDDAAEAVVAEDYATAADEFGAFINELEAQGGKKKITSELAEDLIALAEAAVSLFPQSEE